MEAMPNFAHLGSGKLFIRELGSGLGLMPVGDCSDVNVAPQTNDITLANYMTPGGGTYAKVTRVTDLQISYTFHDFHPENLKRALRGSVGYEVADSVPAEAIVAFPNSYAPLARNATAITSVTPVGGGTAYVEGTDYVLDSGMLYILAGSGIPAPDDESTPNIAVTYEASASGKLQGFSVAQKNYEFHFVGENEANSEQRKILHCHKVSGGVLQQMALIGDDFGEGQVTGSILADPSKYQAGTENSQYFWLDTVSATDPNAQGGS